MVAEVLQAEEHIAYNLVLRLPNQRVVSDIQLTGFPCEVSLGWLLNRLPAVQGLNEGSDEWCDLQIPYK